MTKGYTTYDPPPKPVMCLFLAVIFGAIAIAIYLLWSCQW
jgi:hypothetical protein